MPSGTATEPQPRQHAMLSHGPESALEERFNLEGYFESPSWGFRSATRLQISLGT